MGFAAVGLLCGCLGGLAVLMVAGGLLRLAVHIANRTLAPAKAAEKPARRGGIAEWDWDDWDDEGEAAAEPDRPWRAPRAIPEPGTAKSMAVVLAAALVFVVGFILTGVVATDVGFHMRHDDTKFVVALLNLPVAGLAMTLLLAMSQPTRFWRAALVTFLFGLVVVAFVMFLGLVVLVVSRIR